MSRPRIGIVSPSEQLLLRLNSCVHPVAEMDSRTGLQAVYSMPEEYVQWFLDHCQRIGIRTQRIDGRMSLLQQLAADDLED